MQHDVDYPVCGNKPKSEQLKCKHAADKKNGKITRCNSLERKTMGTLVVQNYDKYKTKTWSWNSKKRASALSSDWSQQLADELHKPITRNFQKRSVISNGIDEIWAADLVEMQKFSRWNKGIKYLLMLS